MTTDTLKSRFSLNNIKGDFFGGITAGVVSLPLAFGLQSGLSPVSGLYCAIFLGAVAVIFGGTYTLISTPTGPMTVVAALTISEAIRVSGSLELAMGTILVIFILSGGIQILFGIFKLGNNVKYIPYPVLSGFMTGIGIILIFFEIYPLIGLASPSIIKWVVVGLPHDIVNINLSALGLGALTLVILYAMPKFSTMIPATLIALIVGTLVSIAGDLNVPLIGEVPQGRLNLQLESLLGVSFLDPWFIISSALTLGALMVFGHFLKCLSQKGDLTSTGEWSAQETRQYFDIFRKIEGVEFDTLLFFFGVLTAVGCLQYIGYLAVASGIVYGQMGPTASNVLIGILSSIVDNIPIMYAVLKMDPSMGLDQWLLITLTAGTGGSLLSIGSAAGVAVMGVAREHYTFMSHLKWVPAIVLGYLSSIVAWYFVTTTLR